MAKKIIRLTEADLTKIVKKVLKEEQGIELPKEMEKCFKEQFKITDVFKYPNCAKVAVLIKLPGMEPKIDDVQACASELMTDKEDVMRRFMGFSKCMLEDLIKNKKTGFDQLNMDSILKDKKLPTSLSDVETMLKDLKIPFDPKDMGKSYFNEGEKKDEEVSWLWKVKKKLKGVSDEQLDYNMRNDLPWDWKGTKEGFYEKMEPRKKHKGSN